MILRATKLVADPRRETDLIELYRAFTQPYTRRQAGNLAVRLYCHVATPNTFFVHSWWATQADIRTALEQPEYAELGERARELAIERLSTWELTTARDYTDGRPVEPVSTGMLRAARVVVAPDEADELAALYDSHTQSYMLRQPGCLGARLMRLIATPNTFFMHSFWRDAEALAAAMAKPEFAAVRQVTLEVVIERIQAWRLTLLEDDSPGAAPELSARSAEGSASSR